MEREIRYCTTDDGVRIAFYVEGQGPPLMLLPWFVESHSFEDLVPETREHDRRLAQDFQVIKFDMRGVGLSQRDVDDLTFSSRMGDITAILEAMGLECFYLMAGGLSGPLAIEFAARNQHRVDKLVLYTTFAFIQEVYPRDALTAFANLARVDWPMAARAFYDTSVRRASNEVGLRYAEGVTRSTDGETVARLLESSMDFDATPSVPRVGCPTLVLQNQNTRPQKWTSQLQDPQIVLLDTDSMYSDKYSMLAMAERVAAFLKGDPLPTAKQHSGDRDPATRAATAIIFFADIVDSTALTERLGDDAFRDRARDLDASLRTIIRDNGGTPIDGKLLGDGVLATFACASQAIGAALACGNAGDDGGLPLHLGLHAGDVIREDNNVFGGAVNVAARISGLSAPGEVLVSDVVRSLARTSANVSFEERGEQALKGVGDPVRVWAVQGSE